MRGEDARGQVGYAVNSISAGVVSLAGQSAGLGNFVVVDHLDGMQSRYGHLHSLSVKTGDQVGKGVPIGTLGSTGRSSGPHLHLEVRDPTGKPVNPATYLAHVDTRSIPTPVFADRSPQTAAAVNPDTYAQMASSMSAAGLLGVDGRTATQGLDPASAYGQLSEGLSSAGLLGVDGRAAAPAPNMSISQAGPGPQSAAANYGQMAASMGAAGLLGTDGRAAAPSQNMSVANMSTGPSVNVATDAAMAADMEAALAAVDPAFGMQGVPTQSVQSVSITPDSLAVQDEAAATAGTQATSVGASTAFAGQPSGLGPATAMNGLGNPMGTPAMMAADQAIADSKAAQASMYGQMATTMSAAGLLGLDGRAAVAAAPAVASRAVAPAAVLAPALSPARDVASRTVSSVPAAPAQSFPAAPSMPLGMDAIQGVFNGTVAQAGSKSHPGTTFTDVGNGWVSKSDQFGNTTYSLASMGPSGAGQTGNFGLLSGTSLSGGLLGDRGMGLGLGGSRGGDKGLGLGLGGFNSIGGRNAALGLGMGMLGSTLGSSLGPVGAMAGGLLGRSIANQIAQSMGRQNVQTAAAQAQRSYTPGLAFPAAPVGRGSTDPFSSSLSYSEMSAISPAAAAAISSGQGGLY